MIPQVYLHYDPRTRIQRGDKQVLARQRMDLLLLLNHGVRVVIESMGDTTMPMTTVHRPPSTRQWQRKTGVCAWLDMKSIDSAEPSLSIPTLMAIASPLVRRLEAWP